MSRRRKPPSPEEARLRVGFVSPGLGVGGAERWVVTLAKHFSKRIKVSGILSYCVTDPLSPEAARICPLYGPWQAGDFMRETDVIIAWGWEYMKREFTGFPGRVIGVSHASPMQDWHCKVCSSMELFPGIELVGVSKRSLDVWKGPHTGVYIPNGAEADRCTPRHGRKYIRKELGIPEDAKVALFLSRIAPEKRPELFCEAVLSLPGWYGIVAGSDIHRISLKLPHCERIKIMPPVEAPGDLLAASDVYVLPSTSEAHPIALTEAWLAGVPTVYCNWPFAQQIRDEHGSDLGIVMPVNSGATLCDLKLAISFASTPLGTKYADLARRIAWEHYTASAMAARWEEYLFSPPPLIRTMPVAKDEPCLLSAS